ncbi:hypothetical protein LY78DRAFT_723805 [Colletotrichum sublineola]|nr:hypothetical protein LY78DRAFT_723805 [Colletotrichum sublineola]
MEWLNKTRAFPEGDIKPFDFHPDKSCAIKIVVLRRGQPVKTKPTLKSDENETLTTEHDYVKWLRSDCPAPDKQQQPSLVLVMHSRLNGIDSVSRVPLNALALPYKRDTFQVANAKLFQHRSLLSVIKRGSTALFNNRQVAWGDAPLGTSIVYNCKSDTAFQPSSESPDDIALSATSFVECGATYAVMYGCKAQTIDLVSRILRKFQDQALHPLLIPMVFAELERKRLFGMLDRKQTSLQQRILDLENKLRGESQSGILENAKNAQSAENADITAQTRDCESTKLWIDVSSLKNGLESLKDQLVKMAEHSEELAATVFKPPPAESAPGTDQYAEERKTGERFAIRLREMVTEFDSKESNYYTRRDAKVAIIIANLTKKDGSQMRSISLLGMLFLPGTFLAKDVFISNSLEAQAERCIGTLVRYVCVHVTLDLKPEILA